MFDNNLFVTSCVVLCADVSAHCYKQKHPYNLDEISDCWVEGEPLQIRFLCTSFENESIR